MNKAVRISLFLLILLLTIGGSAYGWWAYSNHLKVNRLQQQMATAFEAGRQQGGREHFREIREEVKNLPEAYQKELRDRMRAEFETRAKARMDAYYAMSKEERRQEIFRRIAEDEKRRKEWEARRKQREAQGATRTADARNSNSNNKNGQNGQGSGSGNGRGQGNSANGQNSGGRGGGGRGLAGRLDNSSPQMRAQMAGYIRDMNQGRRDMNLPPIRRPGGGGRR